MKVNPKSRAESDIQKNKIRGMKVANNLFSDITTDTAVIPDMLLLMMSSKTEAFFVVVVDLQLKLVL